MDNIDTSAFQAEYFYFHPLVPFSAGGRGIGCERLFFTITSVFQAIAGYSFTNEVVSNGLRSFFGEFVTKPCFTITIGVAADFDADLRIASKEGVNLV